MCVINEGAGDVDLEAMNVDVGVIWLVCAVDQTPWNCCIGEYEHSESEFALSYSATRHASPQ